MLSRVGIVISAAVLLVSGAAAVRGEDKPAPKAPSIEGDWTGTWGPYVPPAQPGAQKTPAEVEADAKKAALYARFQMRLDCHVTQLPNGDFEATFEGQSPRPYKYTIKMLGHAAGPSVLFKGSADLGPKDGGMFDWIGRATDKEFLGFYTNATHVGVFTLARAKEVAKDQPK